MIKSLYDQFQGQVITAEDFKASSGVLHGCILSPHLFNLFLNSIVSLIYSEYSATIGGLLISNLACADDIDVLAKYSQEIKAQANKLYDATKPYYLGEVLEAERDFEEAAKCMTTAIDVQRTSPILDFGIVPLIFE
ncbi:hypothetical protein QYM36_016091 [Artemia franciscana]|uniref:Reverse transcriptase domain-containing protein n=1 Tax=Artemia franciscana TaxID=6661 RepID=A0AA88H6Z1_ARTSF|nr:hypothetical protein QYM36_016091 [Artemia franciscana]